MNERQSVGPVLLARGADAQACRMAALLVVPGDREPPPLIPADTEGVRPTVLCRAAG